MDYSVARRYQVPISSLMVVLALSLGGCVSIMDKLAPPPSCIPVVENNPTIEKLTAELNQQKKITAQLQIKLLEKHSEIDKLTIMNERLVREFVRYKVKLHNRGDKVETVRLIAEVETVIASVKESKQSGSYQNVLLQADKYLTESKSELDEGNVESAAYLASQSLELVQDIQLTTGSDGEQGEQAIVHFVVPLSMKLIETCNVRNGPSMQAKVKFIL
ncbi:MAG: hypothetical protein OEV64_03835, partial [Desulfobulbaceae bacterium]|nr:hypothetical protein [Desulfobulbaceae bacterium]